MIMPVLSEKEITRRRFISKVGRGIVGASVSDMLLKDANAQQLVVPDPPGKKLGWAIVGLGSLSINQILPAFSQCEKSKVVALVSGHPDKGRNSHCATRWTPKTFTTIRTTIPSGTIPKLTSSILCCP